MSRLIRYLFIPALFLISLSHFAISADIAVADLPQKVTQTIQTNYPGAEIVKAERDMDNNVEKFKVEVKLPDGKTKEVKFSSDGRILETED